jgi:hypothetical protein
MEGSGHGFNLKHFRDICLEKLSKITESLVGIVGVAVEIWTEYLLSTKRKR